MSQVIRHPKDKTRPASASRPAMVHVRHVNSAATGWLAGSLLTRRIDRAARANVDFLKRWHRRPLARAGLALAGLGAAALFLRLGLALYGMVLDKPTVVENYCSRTQGACDVVFGFLTPVLGLALATFLFLAWRLWWVARPYLRKARNHARELVPTAGPIIEKVVGRDEFCKVVMQVLRDRDNRRPYLIVGGVGTGKTAVLVRLTEMLAQQHAVPVPVRLREVHEEFDFGKLAARSFCDEVSSGVFPVAFAERVWQQLRKDDRVVVLADGLEEAFAGTDNERDRDNLIRQAIQHAYEQKLPLVIASRPHQPLEATQAAIMELEPLSEEAALDYIEDRGHARDEHRLDWIVETAGVTDAPIYLQITRQLYERGLLEHLTGGSRGRRLDTRGGDRSALRWRLLDTWLTALIAGHLHPEAPIRGKDRKGAVDYVSALACVALLMDRIEVSFEDLIGREHEAADGFGAIWTALTAAADEQRRAARWHHRMSMLSLAASRAEQLGLVAMKGAGVRFQHSIVQAFLGSRFLGALTEEQLKDALQEPGRELLIALVLDSRRQFIAADAQTVPRPRSASSAAWEDTQRMRVTALLEAARDRRDAKAFDLYAAALEIDSVLPEPQHPAIAGALLAQWPSVTIGDGRTLEEAKLGVVRRFGEALSVIVLLNNVAPAYEQLFGIGCAEDSYPVRIAIAQEIGVGGDHAFAALCGQRKDPWTVYQAEKNKLRAAEQSQAAGRTKAYEQLKNGGRPESAGERAAREEQARKIHEDAAEERLAGRKELWRKFVLSAWLAPLLAGSVTDEYRDEATDYLDSWLKHVRRHGREDDGDTLPISMEIALAQGFKAAANRRKRHHRTPVEARSVLVHRAEDMLRDARFWFSHLTLIHALCLWALPDDGSGRDASESVAEQRQSMGPVETVSHWLSMAGVHHRPGERDAGRDPSTEHPFVAEAGDLAVLALRSGHPERFIWIDESGVMNKVGSRPARPFDYRKHNLWIPPSAGWGALDRRAQQLLADVLVLLNLTEGTGEPEEREKRLASSDRDDLPLCLTRDRSQLDPETTIGMPGTTKPDSTCLKGCPFELCPYPPSGALTRDELSEPFCRRQQTLLGRRFPRPARKTAPWQGITPRELSRFWGEMASRTRPRDPRDVL